MPNYFQGTINLLGLMIQSEKERQFVRESPQYQAAINQLTQQKEAALRRQELFGKLQTAKPEEIPELIARHTAQAGPLVAQRGQEFQLAGKIATQQAALAKEGRTVAQNAFKSFEGVTEEDMTYMRANRQFPPDAKGRWKRRLVDPFFSALQRGLGADVAKAQVALPEVESIAHDVFSVLNQFRQIPKEFKGPLAGRTIGQLGKFTKVDPHLVAYDDTKELMLANIAKKLGGEVGVLTDRDIERIKRALPSIIDTQESADQKIRFVLNYVDRRVKSKQKRGKLPQTGISLPGDWFDKEFDINKLGIPIKPTQKPSVLPQKSNMSNMPAGTDTTSAEYQWLIKNSPLFK